MKATQILPNQKIADYADRILIIENNQVTTPFILPLYANGSPTLLFKSVKSRIGNNNANHLTLFGQTVLPETLTLNENFTLIAYFFKPHILVSLFGAQAHELTDKPIDLDLLFPQQTKAVQEKLLNALSIADMIKLLDEFIFFLVKKSGDECTLIKYAAARIAELPSAESLIMVQKELHITERTFQRMFQKNIGISPNLYRRICQFNSAFVQLNTQRHLHHKLSDIAYRHGYADQSHFIRTFKEFTSITPTEYLQL